MVKLTKKRTRRELTKKRTRRELTTTEPMGTGGSSHVIRVAEDEKVFMIERADAIVKRDRDPDYRSIHRGVQEDFERELGEAYQARNQKPCPSGFVAKWLWRTIKRHSKPGLDNIDTFARLGPVKTFDLDRILANVPTHLREGALGGPEGIGETDEADVVNRPGEVGSAGSPIPPCLGTTETRYGNDERGRSDEISRCGRVTRSAAAYDRTIRAQRQTEPNANLESSVGAMNGDLPGEITPEQCQSRGHRVELDTRAAHSDRQLALGRPQSPADTLISLTVEQRRSFELFDVISMDREHDYSLKDTDVTDLFQRIPESYARQFSYLMEKPSTFWVERTEQLPHKITTNFVSVLPILFRGLDIRGDGTEIGRDFGNAFRTPDHVWITSIYNLMEWLGICPENLCRAVVVNYVIRSIFAVEAKDLSLDSSVLNRSPFDDTCTRDSFAKGPYFSRFSENLRRRRQYLHLESESFVQNEIRAKGKNMAIDLVLKLFKTLDTCPYAHPEEDNWPQSEKHLSHDLIWLNIQGLEVSSRPWIAFSATIQQVYEQCLIMRYKMGLAQAKWRFKFHHTGSKFDNSEMVTTTISRRDGQPSETATNRKVVLAYGPTVFVRQAIRQAHDYDPAEGIRNPKFGEERVVSKAPVDVLNST